MPQDDSVAMMLDVYQQPLTYSLTSESSVASQSADIKVPLHPHQLAMICVPNLCVTTVGSHSQM
jgi:hypothetical protein